MLGVDVSESDGTFAWQVIAGVRKAISANIDLGLKYRFFNTTKFKFGETTTAASCRASSGRTRCCRA